MTKQIRLNAFAMNCVAHQSPGLWRHPRDRSRDYKTLAYWTELAQILERGLFDGLFLADVEVIQIISGCNPCKVRYQCLWQLALRYDSPAC